MSTVTEIEAAIEQLQPQEFDALKEWIVRGADDARGRMWTPEESGAAAQRMVDEPDSEKAKAIQVQIVAGFYAYVVDGHLPSPASRARDPEA